MRTAWIRSKYIWYLSCILSFLMFSGTVQAQTADTTAVNKMVQLFQKGSVQAAMSQARQLLSSPSRLKDRQLRGRVYFYLGLMFFNRNQKVLARQSFEKAFEHNPGLRLQIGSPPALRRFVNAVRKDWRTRQSYQSSLLLRKAPPAPPLNTSQLIAWISAGVALVGLTAGLVAGNNAVSTSSQASALLKSSHENKWNEPLMSPTITSLNQQAVSQSVIANIMFGVAGAAAASSVTFFILSSMSSPSRGVAQNGSPLLPMAGTTPMSPGKSATFVVKAGGGR